MGEVSYRTETVKLKTPLRWRLFSVRWKLRMILRAAFFTRKRNPLAWRREYVWLRDLAREINREANCAMERSLFFGTDETDTPGTAGGTNAH